MTQILKASIHCIGGSRGTQRSNLNRPTTTGQLVKVLMSFCNIMDWSPWTTLQLLAAKQNSAYRRSRSARIANASQLANRPLSQCSSNTTKVSVMIYKQCVSSGLKGQVTESHSGTHFIVAVETRPQIDMRMSHRRHGCLNFVGASWVFCKR